MNDSTKVLDQNPISGSQVQPSASLGVANKEIGPIPSAIPEIRRSGPEIEHNISQESAELGVKEIQDGPDLTKIDDIHHAGPHVPVPSSPSDKVLFPMSEEEIASQLKTGQNDDSGKWLAGLIKKIIKAMGL